VGIRSIERQLSATVEFRYIGAMKVAFGHANLARDLGTPPSAPAVAIGSFDGVHRGHQALLAAARADARARGTQAGALTFDPHPARYFAPALAPPLILPLPRRLELLGEAGADFVVVERFDAALAGLTPEAFVDQVLLGGLGVGHVVVGHDFSFGKGRLGSGATLVDLGRRRGFGVTVIPAVTADGVICSSTKIREFLLEGRIEGARLLLGRPPEVTGQVVRGAGRGRGLGIPTANLAVEGDLPLKTGIYAARALLLDAGGSYPAAVSVGTNPTFTAGSDAAPVTVEAYLLDYPGGDLYDSRVRLLFEGRLRDERRFDSVEELLEEIDRDVARARELLAARQRG
jgi:riboflavin kinase/FMN adenylyltransferase